MTTRRDPPQPNQSEIQKAVRFVVGALISNRAFYGDTEIEREYLGDLLVRETGVRQVLPVGQTADITDTPDDAIQLWSAQTLADAMRSERLGTIGLDDLITGKVDFDGRDQFAIKDAQTGDWGFIELQHLGTIIFPAIAINIVATGGTTASYTSSTRTFNIDSSSLKDSWEAAMDLAGDETKRQKVLQVLRLVEGLTDARLDRLLRLLRAA